MGETYRPHPKRPRDETYHTEGAERTKTPNEIALTVLLAVLTQVFLIVVATIPSIGNYIASFLDTSLGPAVAARAMRHP